LKVNFDAVITEKNNKIEILSNIDGIDEKFFNENIKNKNCDEININNNKYWVIQKDNIYIIDKFKCFDDKIKNALYDALTGCYNKKETQIFIEKLLYTYLRYKKDPFSLIMIDIDFFKKINDTYGHLAGDKALKEMTKIVFSLIRQSDFFGRYGGEEFLLVLPNTKITGAIKLAKRIKDSIENHIFEFDKYKIKFTVSIGVTSVGLNDDYKSLISRVDEALYEAKHKGRNRIEYR